MEYLQIEINEFIEWEDIIRGLVFNAQGFDDRETNANGANNEPPREFFGYVKGLFGYSSAVGNRYRIITSNTKTTAVNILDTTIKGKNKWVLRLDNPHRGVPHNHININSKITGLRDPHIPLPNGSTTVGKGLAKTAKILNGANKIMVPIAIAADTYRTCSAAVTDFGNSTTRNTVETVSSIVGGWGGGYGGAVAGASVGSALLPGVGTIIGGIVGGLGFGIGGAALIQGSVAKVGDKFSYDIGERQCLICQRNFKARLYLAEMICIICQEDNFIAFIFI